MSNQDITAAVLEERKRCRAIISLVIGDQGTDHIINLAIDNGDTFGTAANNLHKYRINIDKTAKLRTRIRRARYSSSLATLRY